MDEGSLLAAVTEIFAWDRTGVGLYDGGERFAHAHPCTVVMSQRTDYFSYTCAPVEQTTLFRVHSF